jgi:hypothetical protein
MSKLFQNGMEATLITTWETNVVALTMYQELGFKMILRKKVDGAYFKLFFTRSFEERAPLRNGFSRFWSRR